MKMEKLNIKQFLLKKFPINKYFDCPIPKEYWNLFDEYASQQAIQVEANVSDDLVREVEEKFIKTMLGIPELPQEYPGTYYTNFLKAAYDQARAMNLPENLILKHCCTILNKIINDHHTEKIRQALNSR